MAGRPRMDLSPATLAEQDFRPAGLAELWVLGPSPRMTSGVRMGSRTFRTVLTHG